MAKGRVTSGSVAGRVAVSVAGGSVGGRVAVTVAVQVDQWISALALGLVAVGLVGVASSGSTTSGSSNNRRRQVQWQGGAVTAVPVAVTAYGSSQ